MLWILNSSWFIQIVTGSYRECFSRSYKLGIRSRPIKLTPTCELQRTQRDPSSSIRACLCTTSNCNILDTEKAQFRNTSSNSQTKVVGNLFEYFAFTTIFFPVPTEAVDIQHIKLTTLLDVVKKNSFISHISKLTLSTNQLTYNSRLIIFKI